MGEIMDTITELKVQGRDKTRANLFLNEKYFCSIDLETAVKNGLKIGTMITEEKLNQIVNESEKQTAYSKALKLVSTRYKTQSEVEKYLYGKEYSGSVVYYVISKLVEYGFIDDKKYVSSYVASHRATCGKLKMKIALQQKGISQDKIDDFFKDDFDETEQILSLADKYLKNREKSKENYIKLFRYLVSKGFFYENIKMALKKD